MTRDQLEHVIRAAAATSPYPDAHMHDLAVSKCVAGREKDARFIAAMLKEKMISFNTLEPLIRQLDPKHPIEAIVAWARRSAEEAAT